MNERVLCVAAHPDDEVLGCGGTLTVHQSAGDAVTVLFLADGVSSRGSLDGLQARRDEAIKANAGRDTIFLDFPDNRMDSVDLLDVVKEVEKVVAQINPTIVYTHWSGDLNIDHALTHRAVITACRPLPQSTVKALYYFEVPSATEWGGTDFSPSHFVAIDIQAKLASLQCYLDELRAFPHPRSLQAISAMAAVRGSMCGLDAAEAFMVGRVLA